MRFKTFSLRFESVLFNRKWNKSTLRWLEEPAARFNTTAAFNIDNIYTYIYIQRNAALNHELQCQDAIVDLRGLL